MVYIYIDLDMHGDNKYMDAETIPIIINGWNSSGINLLYGAVIMISVVSQILTICF